jgi:anaerobic selenocysteine-containing dehydrogenase
MTSDQSSCENLLPKGKVPVEGSDIEVHNTICAICNPFSHCDIDAYVKDGKIIKVKGTKNNLHSGGTRCSKGAAGCEYIYHKDRIRTPLLRKGKKGTDDFIPVSWDEALDRTAEQLLKIKKESGPETVVFCAGYTNWMRPLLKRLTHSFSSPNDGTESCCYSGVNF